MKCKNNNKVPKDDNDYWRERKNMEPSLLSIKRQETEKNERMQKALSR